eukprot:TRINITY_DN3214_c0_g1_i2.p1 TRINITY_DN3214_c0_g1~~TRINITY_DN3214_c0_g1_i2.p1  ORF type:complete len:253 (+),score=62.64 TRINITY_DN3214_c0_g1_i2:108-866(+)
MAKKRKSENTGLDEIDRSMYTTFCNAANSLSQLYTQAQHQQKLAFQTGERHSLEKMLQWIARDYETGSRLLPITDIINYIQKELDCGGEEVSMSPSVQHQNQPYCQHQTQHSVFHAQVTSGVATQGFMTNAPRNVPFDQNKSNVFSNMLSSPMRSLQNCHVVQGGSFSSSNASQGPGTRRIMSAPDQDQGHFNGGQNTSGPDNAQPNALNSMAAPSGTYGQHPHQMRDSNFYAENDSAMDMHSDCPPQGFYQ